MKFYVLSDKLKKFARSADFKQYQTDCQELFSKMPFIDLKHVSARFAGNCSRLVEILGDSSRLCHLSGLQQADLAPKTAKWVRNFFNLTACYSKLSLLRENLINSTRLISGNKKPALKRVTAGCSRQYYTSITRTTIVVWGRIGALHVLISMPKLGPERYKLSKPVSNTS